MSLKQADDEANYLCCRRLAQLTRAKDLLPKMPDGEEKKNRWREFLLNSAILFGISGEKAGAKMSANVVLGEFPDDQTAKDILSAIE